MNLTKRYSIGCANYCYAKMKFCTELSRKYRAEYMPFCLFFSWARIGFLWKICVRSYHH